MDEVINTNTIVEDEIYTTFKDSVICPICKSILVEPQLCLKCQSTFCKKCIDEWSKNNEECPNKCSEPNYQNSVGRNEILSKLKFKCKKCGDEYYYHEIQKHYEKCDSTNSFKNEIEGKRMRRITVEEVNKSKKRGESVTYISGKKFFFIFWNIVIVLGCAGIGKTSLIET